MGSVKSECVLMSMKPGATARPPASTVVKPLPGRSGAIAAMRLPLMPRSARTPAAPLPSYTVPLRTRMS